MKILRIFLSLGFIAVVAFAAEPTPTPPKVSKEEAAKLEEEKKTWPKTVDEAVTRILSTMPEKDRKVVRETAKDDLIRFHHGWGTGFGTPSASGVGIQRCWKTRRRSTPTMPRW